MLQQNVRERFNALEYPTWKRVGEIKNTTNYLNKENENILTISHLEPLGEGVDIRRYRGSDSNLDATFYERYETFMGAFEPYPYGTHAKYIAQADAYFDHAVAIEVKKNTCVEEPIFLRYDGGEAQGFIDQNIIQAGPGSEVTVVFDYQSSKDAMSYHNGVIRVIAHENARVKIVILQTFSPQIDHMQNTVSLIHQNAHVEYVSFDLGANVIVSDYSSHLVGQASESEVATAYIGNGHQRLDLGYNSTHYGRYSQSLIETKGALMDHARKIFRGNLKFERGSTKSAGEESEYVLLLDENVRSDALPALLCDEDDVSGEHAASAGQVDEDQLFYLMSRGFNLKEAKKLVIHGSFTPVIDRVGIDSIQERIEAELERRLLYA